MAYIQDFECDIFISFSHVDNQINPRSSEQLGGWIKQFKELMEYRFKRSGLTEKGLKIWLDEERLNGNTDFNETIKCVLSHTALFFAIHSVNYRDNSDYCEKELNWFVEQAKSHPLGLAVNGNKRIFNILIQNIPYNKWTDSDHWTTPLGGAIGFHFHNDEQEEIS